MKVLVLFDALLFILVTLLVAAVAYRLLMLGIPEAAPEPMIDPGGGSWHCVWTGRFWDCMGYG